MAWRVSLAVLAIALVGVVFGLDWQSATVSPPPVPVAVPGQAAPTIDFPPPPPSTAADQAQSSNAPVLPNGGPETPAPRAQATEEQAPPGCNVEACEAAYRSFRKSDCTYQPNNGPRRLCRKR